MSYRKLIILYLPPETFAEIFQKASYIYKIYSSLTQTGVHDLQWRNIFQKFYLYMRNVVNHFAIKWQKELGILFNPSKIYNDPLYICHMFLHVNGRTSVLKDSQSTETI